jgi:hypothetical protein
VLLQGSLRDSSYRSARGNRRLFVIARPERPTRYRSMGVVRWESQAPEVVLALVLNPVPKPPRHWFQDGTHFSIAPVFYLGLTSSSVGIFPN